MNSKKKKVLVIDDQLEILELVDVTLRGTEFDVLKASGGKKGIQIAKEQKPDLILLDIMMPLLDGYLTCKILKRNTATKNIPVIFLTAKKTKEDIKEALKVGGSDYIVKPFSPSELLTRLRRIVGSNVIKRKAKIKEKSTKDEEEEKSTKDEEKEKKVRTKRQKALINFTRHGDILFFTSDIGSIILENCQIYRDSFANIVTDGISKIVFDMSKMQKIDAAGLALLISVTEALKNYGGGLRITFPPKVVNNQFSFIKLNDLFHTFNTAQEAIKSFSENSEEEKNHVSDIDDLNICLSCTFINDSDARYCSFCGTNLVLGKSEKILEIISKTIARKIISEVDTSDVNKINISREKKADRHEISSEFSVEITDNILSIYYISKNTVRKYFETKGLIGIQAPVIDEKLLPLKPGMQLQISNPTIGTSSSFDTKIVSVDNKNKMIFLNYNNDAMIIHSKKNFSVAPKIPIPVCFIIPSLQHAEEIFAAKILELSRVRMIVLSEENIPLNQCMALNYNLPTGYEIASPLVIARKGRQKYIFDIEFKIIDEKESSMITQYMYKRQIELAKAKTE